jgi:hypothetical protein
MERVGLPTSEWAAIVTQRCPAGKQEGKKFFFGKKNQKTPSAPSAK